MSSGLVIQSGRSDTPKPGGEGMMTSNFFASASTKGASSSSCSSPVSSSSGRPAPRRSTSSVIPPAFTIVVLPLPAMSSAFLCGFELSSPAALRGRNGLLPDERDAVTIEADDGALGVGQQDDVARAEIEQDLRADAVLAQLV